MSTYTVREEHDQKTSRYSTLNSAEPELVRMHNRTVNSRNLSLGSRSTKRKLTLEGHCAPGNRGSCTRPKTCRCSARPSCAVAAPPQQNRLTSSRSRFARAGLGCYSASPNKADVQQNEARVLRVRHRIQRLSEEQSHSSEFKRGSRSTTNERQRSTGVGTTESLDIKNRMQKIYERSVTRCVYLLLNEGRQRS